MGTLYGDRLYDPMSVSAEYLAGVFDSDGSFSIWCDRSGNNWRGQLRITWKNTELTSSLMEDIREEYGGNIYRGHSSSGYIKAWPYILYQNHSKRALPLIEAILPRLRLKQRQAELVAQLIRRQRRGRHVRNYEERKAMRQEVRALNSGKGKPVGG